MKIRFYNKDKTKFLEFDDVTIISNIITLSGEDYSGFKRVTKENKWLFTETLSFKTQSLDGLCNHINSKGFFDRNSSYYANFEIE